MSLNAANQPVRGHAIVLEIELAGVDATIAELRQLARNIEARPLSAISRLMPLWRVSACGSVFTNSAKQLP